jgi:hypothetical protein
MPAYETVQPPLAVWPGGDVTIVKTEQLGTGKVSERCTISQDSSKQLRPVTVTFTYASVPASVQYDIYVAWDDIFPGSYTKVGSTNNVNGDQVTLQRLAAGAVNFRFLLVVEVISPAVNATVVVRQ